MQTFLRTLRQDWKIFAILIIFKILVLGGGYVFALILPLPETQYHNFYQYQADDRIVHQGVNFFQLWAYADGQWYLSIADSGYTAAAEDERRFVFFPLWPAVIKLFRFFLFDLTLSAFVATHLIQVLAFYVLYKLLCLYFPKPEETALKTMVLLLSFPFAVFYQLYFTENLFLLLTALAFYWLKKERWGLAAAMAFLLCLTRSNGIVIVIPFGFMLWQSLRQHGQGRMFWSRRLPYFGLLAAPFLGLAVVASIGYFTTGDWLAFVHAQRHWDFQPLNFFENIKNNLSPSEYYDSDNRELHTYGFSRLEYLVMAGFGLLLALSYRALPTEWHLYALMLWIFPLVTKDLTSFGRYMSVNFPLFVFAAQRLPRPLYALVWLLSIAGYAFFLIWIIQWHWVG